MAEFITCTRCGKEDMLPSPSTSGCWEHILMLKERICFSCAFWRAKQERPDPARIVVKGNMYYIGDEDPSVRPSWRGFGGSRFTIRILATGEEIISTNLWHNGDIPEHFLAVFPDTAEFL